MNDLIELGKLMKEHPIIIVVTLAAMAVGAIGVAISFFIPLYCLSMFSLYHLGYPGFCTWEDILLLFLVGIGCAAVTLGLIGLILLLYRNTDRRRQ